MRNCDVLIVLITVSVFFLICGMSSGESFRIKAQRDPKDVSNRFALTNTINERSDKRQDMLEGLKYNFNTTLRPKGKSGSRMHEARYTEWRQPLVDLVRQDSVELESQMGADNDLDDDVVNNRMVKKSLSTARGKAFL